MSLKIGGRLGVTLLSLPFLLYQTSSSLADPIPSDRRTNWQGNVGVPGGIPNRTTIYQTNQFLVRQRHDKRAACN